MAKFKITISNFDRGAVLEIVTREFPMNASDEELDIKSDLEAKAIFKTIRNLLDRVGLKVNEESTMH